MLDDDWAARMRGVADPSEDCPSHTATSASMSDRTVSEAVMYASRLDVSNGSTRTEQNQPRVSLFPFSVDLPRLGASYQRIFLRGS
jgi:hypothetical protein